MLFPAPKIAYLCTWYSYTRIASRFEMECISCFQAKWARKYFLGMDDCAETKSRTIKFLYCQAQARFVETKCRPTQLLFIHLRDRVARWHESSGIIFLVMFHNTLSWQRALSLSLMECTILVSSWQLLPLAHGRIRFWRQLPDFHALTPFYRTVD